MGKTERIHKKTVLIIIGILLLLGISCVNSCSTAKQQNAKNGVYPAEGAKDEEAENTVSGGNALAQKAQVVYTGEETIRVLIQNSDYQGIFHKEVKLSCDTEWELHYGLDGELTEKHAVGEELLLDGNSAWFTECARIVLSPAEDGGKISLLSVNRSQGTPAYRGSMEIRKTGQGFVVINELPVEEYLYGVVPSEMPVSYPMEALKAQAICARTYVYVHLESPGYGEYGAHVDDSTGYQVYNNTAEKEEAIQAVQETKGEVVRLNGELVDTYYYSTSCGVGTTANVWKTAEAEALDYLKSSRLNPESLMQTDGGAIAADSNEVNGDAGPEDLREEEAFRDFITETHAEDYEAQEGWYRWTYTVKEIDVDRIVETLKNRYEANGKLILTLKDDDYVSQNIKAFSKVNDISVVKRGPGGVADEMVIVTDKGTFKVISEYNIRAVLCDGVTKVVRQDGSEVAMPNLLPSAFFVIEPSHDKKNVVGYNIIGGGFGHGVGMSQNGAKNMALQGLGAEQILNFFYEGCEICSGQ